MHYLYAKLSRISAYRSLETKKEVIAWKQN